MRCCCASAFRQASFGRGQPGRISVCRAGNPSGQAVLRSAVECYCVEGAYPESLGYLEENYGLNVNHRDFIVTYEVFASNVAPDVRVLVRGEAEP